MRVREDVHFITAKAESFQGAIKEAAEAIRCGANIAEPEKHMLAVLSQDDEAKFLKDAACLSDYGLGEGLSIRALNAILQAWIEEDVIGYVADFLSRTSGELTKPISSRRYLEALSPCGTRVVGNYLLSAAALKTFRRNYGDAEADVLRQDFNAYELGKYGLTNLANEAEIPEPGREEKKLRRYVIVMKTIL